MAIEASTHEALQRAAKDHLWLHFSTTANYEGRDVPVIVRGEGCHLYDTQGRRYLDMLAGLFTVQIGYSHGDELGEVAAEQMRRLPFYTNWTYAHPPAIELAEKLAEIAPANINRSFFVSGGSEAVEAAWKLARQYHAHRGQPMRRKVIARKLAYHGTTMGALSITGISAIRTPFEPLIPGVRHVANTNRYRCKYCAEQARVHARCADEIAEAIEFEGPETVAMVIMEPVQNSGGTFTPHPRYHQRVREICDAYGVLQVSDEVICGVRQARRVVRRDQVRLRARHHHDREGAHVGLPAARRRDDLGQGRRAVPGGWHLAARHHVRRAPGRRRRSACGTSRSWSARTCSGTSGATRATSTSS